MLQDTFVLLIVLFVVTILVKRMSFIQTFGVYLYLLFDIIREFSKNVFRLRQMCRSDAQLDNKVVIITGANTGIGKETAYQLSLRKAKIIIGCRDIEKGENAVKHIKEKNPKADIIVMKLNLSSLTSVRQFVKSVSEKMSKIDILINNAGVMTCPQWKTEDGFEMQFGTNHLGHFLLTLSLLPLLKKSPRARIITLSSMLYVLGQIHFENINLLKEYTPLKAYAQSKLAAILFTKELAKRLGLNSNVKAYSLHPGIVFTDLSRHLGFGKINTFLMKTLYLNIERGVQTTLYCALEENIENLSGKYFNDCKPMNKLMSNAENERTAEKLWKMSCDLVKLENHLKI